MGYLDGNGLAYLWGKISAALTKKQDAASAVTMEQVNEAIQTAISAAGGGIGGGGSTGEAPGEIYSTQEQVIGRWIDNKPLYRQTFEIYGISTSGRYNGVLVNLPDCKIHNWYGYFEDGYNQYPLNFNRSDINLEYQVGSERFVFTQLEGFGQVLTYQTGYNTDLGYLSAVVTVEYTKTDD